MAFSEAASVAYGGAGAGQVESPNHHHQESESQSQFEKSLEEQLASSPLNKQGSIFSLTLDEFQVKSGKSVGSMNMDEFLTNLWNNVDDPQLTSQSQPPLPVPPQPQPPTVLTRQNSFSIPIQLCKKTVEEVWSEIQQQPQQQQQQQHRNGNHIEPPQRQPTFGEITLEEFLIKAGVVQEPSANNKQSQQQQPPNCATLIMAQPTPINTNGSTCTLDATCYGAMGMGHSNNNSTCSPMMPLGFSTQPSNLLVNGYATYPIYTTPTKLVAGDQLANNNNMINNNNIIDQKDQEGLMVEAVGTPKGNCRKRIIDGPHEVVVERRQRRMIKNRESAARSRARKQAYTVELELELTQLKEENDKLKEAVEELKQKRVQEVLKRMKQPIMARKKSENSKLRTLKRIASSTW